MDLFDRPSTRRHPKCNGRVIHYLEGDEFDCGYDTTLTCDECKYGVGRKDPEAKHNLLKKSAEGNADR